MTEAQGINSKEQAGTLEGRTAVVTGTGHPRGMGAAIARRLAEEGARVVVTDIPAAEEAIGELARAIEADGGTAMAVTVDVTQVDQIEACVRQTVDAYGDLSILVNNAGLGIGSAEFLDNSAEIWARTFAVNVFGVAEFCRAAIPAMRGSGGVIVNNSSLAGIGSPPGTPAHYVASKHAVIGLTRSLALEFGPEQIRCLAICPGSVKTQLYDAVMQIHMEVHDCSYEEAEAMEVDAIPLGYSCEPEAVADMVACLCGPAGRYVTGVALPIAGGMAPGL